MGFAHPLESILSPVWGPIGLWVGAGLARTGDQARMRLFGPGVRPGTEPLAARLLIAMGLASLLVPLSDALWEHVLAPMLVAALAIPSFTLVDPRPTLSRGVKIAAIATACLVGVVAVISAFGDHPGPRSRSATVAIVASERRS